MKTEAEIREVIGFFEEGLLVVHVQRNIARIKSYIELLDLLAWVVGDENQLQTRFIEKVRSHREAKDTARNQAASN